MQGGNATAVVAFPRLARINKINKKLPITTTADFPHYYLIFFYVDFKRPKWLLISKTFYINSKRRTPDAKLIDNNSRVR